MKKYLFFAAALVALASCSDDNFVGDNSPTLGGDSGDGAIVFSPGAKTITRANHVGADAANLLNNKFIVGGFKGDGSAMTQVFDNYIVQWTENTAGKTQSNTSDWEYVGVTAAAPSQITGLQTIKYWDYSTSQYDFAAFSTGNIAADKVKTTGTPGAGEVVISGISKADTYAGPTYTITGAAADLAKCYISDMVTVYKADYQKEVQLTFRNLATKVRVALYETIPGYSVKDVKFYSDNTTTLATGTSEQNVTLFAPNTGDADKFFNAGTATVSFTTIGSTNTGNSDYNKAHVTFTASDGGTSETKNFGTLNYTVRESRESDASSYLARNSSAPTFAGAAANNYYMTVLPNETGTVLELRVNYTLVATDGSGEEIKIYGATAYIPAIYATWKSNYAYTYIFKISDATNGWTSQVITDPQGLYPITFDAVVVDAEENTQSTITTVATPSITTYQKGHDVSKEEYLASTGDIYVQVMNDGTLATNLTTEGISKLYTLSGKTNPTEADVMDALNIQAYGSTADAVKGRNGLNMATATIANNITAIPGANGNDITVSAGTAAKFTPAAGTYAYVYYTGTDNADSNIYSAITLTADDAPADWSGNYWDNPDGTGDAVTTYVKDKTYYRHYTNLNKVYGVKVIKVQ